LAEALGSVLAHGIPAASLSKGITLEAGHLETLRNFGFQDVTVAQLEDGDVLEDEAAMRLARALVPDEDAQGLRLTPASSGRVNIMAHRAGLLDLDVARITAMNRVDATITVATLPNLKRVTAGVMVASIKVIPYALPEAVIQKVGDAAGSDGFAFAMNLRQAVLKTATLIETHHPGQRPQPKGRRVLDERLDRLGCALVETLDVPHEESAIASAFGQAKGEVIFTLTASATLDVHDTGPNALRQAGGKLLRFGMPVDPGNLLFLGSSADGRPVIGLPGCARSPSVSGADWIIERILFDLPVGDDDISALGVGGLLKDTPERGRLRTER